MTTHVSLAWHCFALESVICSWSDIGKLQDCSLQRSVKGQYSPRILRREGPYVATAWQKRLAYMGAAHSATCWALDSPWLTFFASLRLYLHGCFFAPSSLWNWFSWSKHGNVQPNGGGFSCSEHTCLRWKVWPLHCFSSRSLALSVLPKLWTLVKASDTISYNFMIFHEFQQTSDWGLKPCRHWRTVQLYHMALSGMVSSRTLVSNSIQ